MFYGDSVITPAISVLSAVEGLEVVSPQFESWVIPLTLRSWSALFAVQRTGTAARRQRLRARSCCCGSCRSASWAPCRSRAHPGVLAALSPLHAASFFIAHPAATLTVMALGIPRADGRRGALCRHGPFRRRPIQVAWFWLVMPCLVLNYFGQGAWCWNPAARSAIRSSCWPQNGCNCRWCSLRPRRRSSLRRPSSPARSRSPARRSSSAICRAWTFFTRPRRRRGRSTSRRLTGCCC